MKMRSESCNVLIIGTGAAGLRAAIAAHESNAEVQILGKRLKKDAHTVLAAGGVNAVFGSQDPEDTWVQHFVDTFKEGYYLADPTAVEILCLEAPERVMELADWGCPFARMDDGKLDQRYFGAHKYRRTCYAGDWTGRAMLYTLVDKVESLGIPIFEHRYVWSLLSHEGSCFGAVSFDVQSGDIIVHQADQVILATGGHTRLWKHSSSRRGENTGDGFYLALKAGAYVGDMELVQFHPTGMTYPDEWIGTLVTEAVRGEGGYLLNAKGERYMERYDPARMELSTRDRIALANYTEIAEGRGTESGGVLLDVSHLGKERILKQLPRMYRQFIEAQMKDISKEPMEVAPTAHYSMGGVVVDPKTHLTHVRGLYAVGEVTSGVHGANRLGGNSLAETIVFGKIAGEQAAAASKAMEMQIRSPQAVQQAIDFLKSFIKEGEHYVRPLQREVRTVMWECCGVVRNEEKLKEGLRRIAEVERKAKDIDVRPTEEGYQDLANVLDLHSALLSSRLTLESALRRRESRGAHQRSDYPEISQEYRKNIRIRLDGDLYHVWEDPVPPLRPELEKMLRADEDYQLEGRLLE